MSPPSARRLAIVGLLLMGIAIPEGSSLPVFAAINGDVLGIRIPVLRSTSSPISARPPAPIGHQQGSQPLLPPNQDRGLELLALSAHKSGGPAQAAREVETLTPIRVHTKGPVAPVTFPPRPQAVSFPPPPVSFPPPPAQASHDDDDDDDNEDEDDDDLQTLTPVRVHTRGPVAPVTFPPVPAVAFGPMLSEVQALDEIEAGGGASTPSKGNKLGTPSLVAPTMCPANWQTCSADLYKYKVYKDCIEWDTVLFFVVGLFLAFGGYKLYKVACAAIGFVVPYVFLPSLKSQTDLSLTVCYIIIFAVGVLLAALFWFLADSVGIFAMGFVLGALLGWSILMLLCMIDDVNKWFNEHSWARPALILVLAIGNALYGIQSSEKMNTVVSATSLLGSYLCCSSADYWMGGGQLKYGIEKFTDFVNSDGTGQHQMCKLTQYWFIGIAILAMISGCIQATLLKRDQARQQEEQEKETQVHQHISEREQEPLVKAQPTAEEPLLKQC